MLRLYLDGTLVNEGVSTQPSPGARGSASGLVGIDSGTVFDKIHIGTNAGENQPINSYIDEVSIHSGPISSSDVTTLYNSGVPGKADLVKTLVGWWRFESNTDDSSSNSNSATLSNGASFNSSVPS